MHLISVHCGLGALCVSQVYKACASVGSEAEAQEMMERYSTFLLATLSIEVDRLEHRIQSSFPEFQYIDLEVL